VGHSEASIVTQLKSKNAKLCLFNHGRRGACLGCDDRASLAVVAMLAPTVVAAFVAAFRSGSARTIQSAEVVADQAAPDKWTTAWGTAWRSC
jgi:hypothetical protein